VEEGKDVSLKIWQKKSHEADVESADPRICAQCKSLVKKQAVGMNKASSDACSASVHAQPKTDTQSDQDV
jgi:hypothetical protein